MLDGETCIRKCALVGGPASVINGNFIFPNPNPGCCNDYVFSVLADNSALPPQNDINTVIWWFNQTATGATMTLKRWEGGAWVIKATISDNTYGTYGAFGYFVNNEGQSFISLQIAWSAVLAAFGEGSYKVTCAYIDPILGNGSVDSYEYCLKTYSPLNAEGTIRLEYWNSGVGEDLSDDTRIRDFGTLNIYNTMRVKGLFGYQKSPMINEFIEYTPGNTEFVEMKRDPEYVCEIVLIPEFKHEILRSEFMLADMRAITDYNSRNNKLYITKFVIPSSEYSPEYYELEAPTASVKLKFKPRYNRSRKFRP